MPALIAGFGLGFLIGGYRDTEGRVYDVSIGSEEEMKCEATTVSTSNPSLVYRGQTTALRRVFLGFDPDAMIDEGILATLGLDEDGLVKAMQPAAYRPNPTLTLQDAVDLCLYAIQVTVMTQRFTNGTARHLDGAFPLCGGPVQAAAASRKGIRWLLRPELRFGYTGVRTEGP